MCCVRRIGGVPLRFEKPRGRGGGGAQGVRRSVDRRARRKGRANRRAFNPVREARRRKGAGRARARRGESADSNALRAHCGNRAVSRRKNRRRKKSDCRPPRNRGFVRQARKARGGRAGAAQKARGTVRGAFVEAARGRALENVGGEQRAAEADSKPRARNDCRFQDPNRKSQRGKHQEAGGA